MRGWFHTVIALGTSPVGVVLLAALDSTVFFTLPFGIDVAVIGLAARGGKWAWIVPLLATAGATVGGAITYWMGERIGAEGLERFASPRRVARVRKRTQESGAVVLALFQLIPPPFPFTLFVLAAGALKVKRSTFFGTLTVCRIGRFGLEAALAVAYGTRINAWLQSDAVTEAVKWIVVLCLAVTVLALVRLFRASPPSPPSCVLEMADRAR
jgi:membrane protein YqaA with SNARE-associated domain